MLEAVNKWSDADEFKYVALNPFDGSCTNSVQKILGCHQREQNVTDAHWEHLEPVSKQEFHIGHDFLRTAIQQDGFVEKLSYMAGFFGRNRRGLHPLRKVVGEGDDVVISAAAHR